MSRIFNEKYNYDNTIIRNIFAGFIGELDGSFYYYQQLDETTSQKVLVPVLPIMNGSEQFLKDEFHYDALANNKAIGDYERIPRCMISMSGISINSSEQVNKYIKSKFVREVNGVLRTCYLMTNYVPIKIAFNCDLICSNVIEQLKITECIITKLYNKYNMFNLDLGICVVQAVYDAPEDYQRESPIDFGVNDKKEFKTSFVLNLKTFLPCFENGLLLSEIDEMLKNLDNTKPGIVEFRADNNGNLSLVLGGLLENITNNNYTVGDNDVNIITR